MKKDHHFPPQAEKKELFMTWQASNHKNHSGIIHFFALLLDDFLVICCRGASTPKFHHFPVKALKIT